jgi:hypothetical protein
MAYHEIKVRVPEHVSVASKIAMCEDRVRKRDTPAWRARAKELGYAGRTDVYILRLCKDSSPLSRAIPLAE